MQSLEKILSIQSNLGPPPCFRWRDDELQPINDDDPRTVGTRRPTDLGTWLTVTRLGFFAQHFLLVSRTHSLLGFLAGASAALHIAMLQLCC